MKESAGKRILMLLENNPYPQDIRVQREARTLVEAGYFVSVIAPAGQDQPWHEVIDDVKTFRYPAPADANSILGYLWEYVYSLSAAFILALRIYLQYGFDVIHAHNPPDTFVFIGIFFKIFGVRFVFDHHDLSPEMFLVRFRSTQSKLIHQFLIWLEKLSCKISDHVIATNESYKAMEMERSGVPEEKITIVRNGPDLTRVHLVGPDPALRQKADIIIAYVGNMGYQDGVDYFIRALWHLYHDLGRTDFYSVIIGKGVALKNLRELTINLGLEDHLWFTGRISDADLLRYLSTADICVDPDPSNSFNDRCTMIKITEYMALAKPIVAFDLPENRFTAQSAALFVKNNDELEFARALAKLMDDESLRKEMGDFGRERIRTELAWQYSAKNLLIAYTRLFTQPQTNKSPLPIYGKRSGVNPPEEATEKQS